MATRVVDGPDENWLSIRELAKEIGIEETAIRERLKAKPPRFPQPKSFGRKRLWSWRVVLWWELKSEFEPEEGEAESLETENLEHDLTAPSRAKPRQTSFRDKPAEDG